MSGWVLDSDGQGTVHAFEKVRIGRRLLAHDLRALPSSNGP
jgi:hypothetical protein